MSFEAHDIAYHNLKIILFVPFTLCMAVLLNKVYYDPQWKYGHRMIIILLGSLFITSTLRLTALFSNEKLFFMGSLRILNKFSTIWIIAIGLYYHFIIKSSTRKLKVFPFNLFIILASLINGTISLGTSLMDLKPWYEEFLPIHITGCIIMGIICLHTCYFRRQLLTCGPESIIREYASWLIQFSLIQFGFFAIYIIRDLISLDHDCLRKSLAESERDFCALFKPFEMIIYQCWIWYAIHFNWKMISMKVSL